MRGAPELSETVVVTAAGTHAMHNSGILVINKTTPEASAVTLPASPTKGRIAVIKDGGGNASTYNITITPAAGNIDGAATYVISKSYGSVYLVYNGTEWGSIAQGLAVSAAELATLSGVTPGTAAASKAVVLDASGNIATINAASIVNATITGRLSITDTATLAATGTVIGNAAAITHTITTVTGADDAKGVVLPATVAGSVFLVYSSQATNGLKCYPPINSTINDGSANAAIVVEGKSLSIFVATSATNYASIFTVNA